MPERRVNRPASGGKLGAGKLAGVGGRAREGPLRDVTAEINEAMLSALMQKVVEGDPGVLAFFSANPDLVASGLELLRSQPCVCRSGKAFCECCGRNMTSLGEEVSAEVGQVAALPRSAEVWELATRELEAWFQDENGVPTRAHMIVCVQEQGGPLLRAEVPSDTPTMADCAHSLLKSCVRPMVGHPRRPALVRVDEAALLAELIAVSDRLVIELELVSSLPNVEDVVDEMEEAMGEDDAPPGLLRTPGVTAAAVHRAFGAAADFHRGAPWRWIGDDLPIEIRSALAPEGSCVAVVMGNGGINYGLVLFDTLEDLGALYARADSDDGSRLESARALNVNFDAVDYLPPDDHHDLVVHKWPVAGKEAYPVFMRVEPGSVFRRPLCGELELLEAAMRALPAFIERHLRRGGLEAPARDQVLVETSGGPREMTLLCPATGFLEME